MSIDASKLVWDRSQQTGTARLVMLALADNANAEGYAWPGFEKLAEMCRCSERQVSRIIADLEVAGELYVERGVGRRNYTRYLITLDVTVDVLSQRMVKYLGYSPIQAVEAATEHLEKDDTQGEKATRVSPFEAQGKDDIQGEKMTSRVEKMTSKARKDDIAMSPDPLVDPSTDPILLLTSAPAQFPDIPPIELIPAATTINQPTVVKAQGPYMQPGMRLPGGYIPAGQGQNAVQIYYERFSYADPDARLNRPNEDDLARLCPDLAKLREVITAYSRTNYRPGNVSLILDWYRNGVPSKERSSSKSAGYGRQQEKRGGTSPRKEQQDALDQDTLDFIASFVDARDGSRAIAAD